MPPPSAILEATSLREGVRIVSKRDIYNLRAKLCPERNNAKVIDLIDFLQYSRYIILYDHHENGKVLKSLFFCHENSVEKARRFSEVIIIDVTYRTNNLGLPLANVVGIGNTAQDALSSFLIACAYVSNQRTDSYDLFVRHLKEVVFDRIAPGVIVTDNDKALVSTIEKHFSRSSHILCAWHVKKNFEKLSFEHFSVEDDRMELMDCVNGMLNCKDEEEFAQSINAYEAAANKSQNAQVLKDYLTM